MENSGGEAKDRNGVQGEWDEADEIQSLVG